jgi:hypothetical protein
MKEITYRAKVVRRRGRWHVSVPALPRDAPVIKITKLDNAAPLLIDALSAYLGASMQSISVEVSYPSRPPRRGLAARVSATAVQVLGGAGAAAGLYLLAGYAVTLTLASIAAIVLGTLREAGKI